MLNNVYYYIKRPMKLSHVLSIQDAVIKTFTLKCTIICTRRRKKSATAQEYLQFNKWKPYNCLFLVFLTLWISLSEKKNNYKQKLYLKNLHAIFFLCSFSIAYVVLYRHIIVLMQLRERNVFTVLDSDNVLYKMCTERTLGYSTAGYIVDRNIPCVYCKS